MKAQILKIAGVKSEKEFYKKYPTEESFFSAHPEAEELLTGQANSEYQMGGSQLRDTSNPLVKMQVAGQVDDTSWIKKILDYEALHGSPTGTGLSNWGYNSRNPKTIDEAIDFYKKDFLPKVQQYAPGLRERAGDFIYNAGRDPRIYMLDQYLRTVGDKTGLANRGSYNIDMNKNPEAWAKMSPTFEAEWNKYKDQISSLPIDQQIGFLDKGRDFYYQNINQVNGKPSAAYNATWKPRLGIFGQYKAPAQTTTAKPVQATQTATTTVAQPVQKVETPKPVQTAKVETPKPVQVNTQAAQNTQTVTPTPQASATAAQSIAATTVKPITQASAPIVQPIQTATTPPAFNTNTGVLNQNQNASGLNMPFTVGTPFIPQPIQQPVQQVVPAAPVSAFDWKQNNASIQNITAPQGNVFKTDAVQGTTNTQQNIDISKVPLNYTANSMANKVAAGLGSFSNTVGKVGDYINNLGRGYVGKDKDGKLVNKGWDFGSMTDNILSAANIFGQTALLNNKQAQEESNRQMLRSQNAGWNQQYDSQLNRGDYSQGPSSYGLFRPNQMSFDNRFEEGGISSLDIALGSDTFVPNITASIVDYSNMPNIQAPSAESNYIPTESSSLSLKDLIASTESQGNYKALPKNKDGSLASSAAGKYQFLWKYHKDAIKNVTGVASKEDFLNNPDAQEKYFDYWDASYLTPNAEKIKKLYNPAQDTTTIKRMIHFAGAQGAMDWYGKGKVTTDAFGTTNESFLNKIKGGVKTKSASVNINNLHPGLSAFTTDISNQFPGVTVSSANDSSQHMKGSKHYENKAIDIGANSSNKVAYDALKKFAMNNPQLKQQYGIEDIIDEGDHLHVELFQSGGEYTLTADQIMQIKAMGGDVEFI